MERTNKGDACSYITKAIMELNEEHIDLLSHIRDITCILDVEHARRILALHATILDQIDALNTIRFKLQE